MDSRKRTSTAVCRRRRGGLAALAWAVAACAALVGRCVTIENAESLTDLGWGTPDIHFVYAMPQPPEPPTGTEEERFVPATAEEWRKYAQWLEKTPRAGVDEELVRQQQGVFWRDEVAEMPGIDGRPMRCYHELRPFVSQEMRQRRAAKRAEASQQQKQQDGGEEQGEDEHDKQQMVEDYFRARDYAAADALLDKEADHGKLCMVYEGGGYTYQLCPNKHAEQRRVEGSIVVERYTLGSYSNAYNTVHDRAMLSTARQRGSLAWFAAGDEPAGTHVTRFEHDARGRRYVQFYSSGDTCWATKLPRVAEVVYTCHNKSGATTPFITSVTEKMPCQYVISVLSPALCKHPFFAKSFGLAEPSHDKESEAAPATGREDSDPERLVLCVVDRTPEESEGKALLKGMPSREMVMGPKVAKTEDKKQEEKQEASKKQPKKQKGEAEDLDVDPAQLAQLLQELLGVSGKNVKVKAVKVGIPQQGANGEDELQQAEQEEHEGQGEVYVLEDDDDFDDGDDKGSGEDESGGGDDSSNNKYEEHGDGEDDEDEEEMGTL